MNDSFMPKPSRRSLLAMAALGGMALTAKTASGASAAFDPAAPENLLKTFMRMRAALDDRLVIGFLEGRYYGVVEEELTPLYGVVSATFSRYRPLADGGYESVTREIAFFTDLETKKALETWHNPYTNEIVTVQQPNMPGAQTIIGKDISLRLPKPIPGAVLDFHVYARTPVGDSLCLVEESFTKIQVPGQTKSFHYNEIVTMTAKKADLMVPDTKRVPCSTAYESVVSWRPWLKMGDHPGHLIASGSGGYGISLDKMPSGFLDAIAIHHPEILKDPASSIDGLWNEKS